MKFTAILLSVILSALASNTTKAGEREKPTKVAVLFYQEGNGEAVGSMVGARDSNDDKSHVTIVNGAYYSSVFFSTEFGVTQSCTTTDPKGLEMLRSAQNDSNIYVRIHGGKCSQISIGSRSSYSPKS